MDGGALLEPHVSSVARFVRFLVGDAVLTQDIVQETMVRALGSLGRYDPARPVAPWLRGIAAKVVYKHRRRIRRTRRAEEELLHTAAQPADGATPEDEALMRERVRQLYAALDTLPPRWREALMLHVGRQLPAEEVARLTGTTVGTVYTRVFRARERVRGLLVRAGVRGAKEEAAP